MSLEGWYIGLVSAVAVIVKIVDVGELCIVYFSQFNLSYRKTTPAVFKPPRVRERGVLLAFGQSQRAV